MTLVLRDVGCGALSGGWGQTVVAKGAGTPGRPTELERIQKVLASAGIASRRHCEDLVKAGRVAVNGQVVTQMGAKVDSLKDHITVDGEAISSGERAVYLVLNKPPGYLTALDDSRGRATVSELIVGVKERVFPIGRLDKDTEGLLLLTNDGDLAYRLAHPRYGVEKEYLALVEGEPTEKALEEMRQGVEIAGRLAVPHEVVRAEGPHGQGVGEGRAWLCVSLKEGRKREVRRICHSAGYPILRLIRTRIGPLHLADLPPGHYRHLTAGEVDSLRCACESSEG